MQTHHPLSGMAYLIQGFKLITQPGLRLYVIIPVIINFILFAGLFVLLHHLMGEFNQWVAHFLPTWLQWLNILFWFLFFVSFFILFIYTFMTIANLISAPFNSLLAEKVEWYVTGKQIEQRRFIETLKDLPRLLGRQFTILAYYLPRALLILILFFIPVVHIIAIILWFLFNAWFLTLTYLDYPTDNHRIPLMRIRAWQKQKPWLSLSFGMSILFASMIPIVNFFTIPAAVAAATQLWLTEGN
jgi:CysZ protein